MAEAMTEQKRRDRLLVVGNTVLPGEKWVRDTSSYHLELCEPGWDTSKTTETCNRRR